MVIITIIQMSVLRRWDLTVKISIMKTGQILSKESIKTLTEMLNWMIGKDNISDNSVPKRRPDQDQLITILARIIVAII